MTVSFSNFVNIFSCRHNTFEFCCLYIIVKLPLAIRKYEKKSPADKRGYFVFHFRDLCDIELNNWRTTLEEVLNNYIGISEGPDGSSKNTEIKSRFMVDRWIVREDKKEDSHYITDDLLFALKMVLESAFPGRKVLEPLKVLHSRARGPDQDYHFDYNTAKFCLPPDPEVTEEVAPHYKDISDPFQSFSFMLAMQDGTKLRFKSLEEESHSWDEEVVFNAGDVCVWTAGCYHGGASYDEDNYRLFGYMPSKFWAPNPDEIHFYSSNSKR